MKQNIIVAVGELVGYKNRLNPLSRFVYLLVKVNNGIVQVPIDYRQRFTMCYDYPVGSAIELGYDGNWFIRNKIVSPEPGTKYTPANIIGL